MPDITVIIGVRLRDDCYSSQFGFPRTPRNGWTDRMRDVTAGMEYFVLRAHAHARTHGYARVYTSASRDVSRRSSRQILFRKIGLPLSSTTERQQLCVGGSSRRTNTRTRAWVRARLKNFRGYHAPPESFLLLQHSISRFSLLRARPRYLTNFFFFFFRYISTMRNDVARYGECRQTIGSRNPRLSPWRAIISRTEVWGSCNVCALKHLPKV